MWARTFQLRDRHRELVALLQHALAALLYEGVEARRELGHAVAQIVEAEVDAWEAVRRRWRGHCLSSLRASWFEDGCHSERIVLS